jgi:hypothetical protein
MQLQRTTVTTINRAKLNESLPSSEQTDESQPPVSLEGQLIWREFYYYVG